MLENLFKVWIFEFSHQNLHVKSKKKSIFICLFVSFVSQKSFISFATSRNQTFYFATIFKSMSSIRLNFSIASHEISSKRAKIATILITRNFTSKQIEIVTFNCSFIFSFSFFRTFVSKFYFIIDNLIRMFYEKFKSFDLRQHHNRRFFSQNFDFRQFSQSCFSISKKFYFIMNNLNRIFDKKFKKKICFNIKWTLFFKHFQIKCESSFISSLQSIKNRRLFRIQKIQNRKVWINTCLRNQFALFSTKICLKNRSNYYTKCSMFSTSIRKLLFSFLYFFVFFRFFFLFSHSFRSFSLQKRIVLTFINKSFRSLIMSILNLSFRNEIEKKRKINYSNIQSRNIKNSSFQFFTLKITYKITKKSTVICLFVSFISFIFFCNIKIDILFCIDIWIIITKMFAFLYCDIQYYIKIDEKSINIIFSIICHISVSHHRLFCCLRSIKKR